MPTAGPQGDVLMWDNIGTVHNAVPDYACRRAALHAARPGDGDEGLRPPGRLSRAGTEEGHAEDARCT